MKMQFECRTADCPALIEYRPLGKDHETLDCPRCARTYTLENTSELLQGHAPTRCVLCKGEEFFKRKDFPQKLGLGIVIVAALISLATLRDHFLLAYGVLAAAVVLDLIIYYMIGVVLVCYRCRTDYWSVAISEQHDWFDLATSEKYL
jgi:hypothetical protein